MIIREAMLERLRAEHKQDEGKWEKDHEGKLAVSEIGHCVRQAYLRLADVEQTNPPNDYLLELFRCGYMWEAETRKALQAKFGNALHWDQKNDPLMTVGGDIWKGHIDFWIDPQDKYPELVIVEHKATSPVNFVRKDRLPYPFHCLQALAYEKLLRHRQNLGGSIKVLLYYRSWTNWAEFQVWEDNHEGWATPSIFWEGKVNGKPKSGLFELSLPDEVAAFESWWGATDLPPKYETPFTKQFGCFRQVKKRGHPTVAWPSCKYFTHCWGDEYPGNGPFEVPG